MPRLLPVLGLPLLADGALTLVLKLRGRLAGSSPPEPLPSLGDLDA